jgi:uncharacterized protein YodC (DUF2158 family)
MGKFNPGDVVRLKSGGPSMTIGEPRTVPFNGNACYWFSGPRGQQLLKSEVLPAEALEAAKPDQDSDSTGAL